MKPFRLVVLHHRCCTTAVPDHLRTDPCARIRKLRPTGSESVCRQGMVCPVMWEFTAHADLLDHWILQAVVSTIFMFVYAMCADAVCCLDSK